MSGESPMTISQLRMHFHGSKLREAHRDDSRVVGQEVARGHMTRLVLCTANIQGELNRTLWAEIITGTVLGEKTQNETGSERLCILSSIIIYEGKNCMCSDPEIVCVWASGSQTVRHEPRKELHLGINCTRCELSRSLITSFI